ncbi:MAG: hypothetical protein AUJ92_00815 [Armatimonadetes bacterium CG2_30_59_28]|nr:hypothetical protein [Armatimonadota bacterium]OIO98743.1 MAG: hypothetical protein AUJ92_00815 [Armatimonadetes bacterium CG2_30_59_28]PIU66021.1 MAG: hypothetical protein COS85_06480 [Armatimonadetes bacterium CG07_land_8_20_14_0_80_59_28]PIX44643.1 MAG: hypothetical protein COZ56_04070 [Armatimonadetes bacterium CG_4_8_14_3_um_filter_58_9]PIY49296.1 MAG: hypothetical protein COZ05_00825 [Armatimonadetes bacterium CG_4_10_14_3_um_filter_59_10]PJB62611.1 MAG: hypothetical protein CO095_181
MRLQKRTYALPPDTLEQFEQTVAAGKRSMVIAQILQEWLEEKRREQLRQDVIEGCQVMADVMLEIQQEFEPLDMEVWRAIDDEPETRRRRSSTTRSHGRV